MTVLRANYRGKESQKRSAKVAGDEFYFVREYRDAAFSKIGRQCENRCADDRRMEIYRNSFRGMKLYIISRFIKMVV